MSQVEIVVPVYNEQAGLSASIRRLHSFLQRTFPFSWRIVIADNASTDGTLVVARALAAELTGVDVLHVPAKGRGRALRAAWSSSDADVVAYMDVDLSTDLRALLPLVAPLVSGHSDVAIGSRLARGARVQRGPKRELISRAYNGLLRGVLRARFSDAQCGFKAVRGDVARELVPQVRDESWFFDTELLVLAQRRGLRIHEVPVDWVDDPDSRVDIVATAIEDLRGVARLMAASPTLRLAGARAGTASGLLKVLRRPLERRGARVHRVKQEPARVRARARALEQRVGVGGAQRGPGAVRSAAAHVALQRGDDRGALVGRRLEPLLAARLLERLPPDQRQVRLRRHRGRSGVTRPGERQRDARHEDGEPEREP